MIADTKQVNGDMLLRVMRFDFEKIACCFLAVELTQGRDAADRLAQSIGSIELRKNVLAVVDQLRKALALEG
jgi:hypothetical protein